jgi:hypothetical protein
VLLCWIVDKCNVASVAVVNSVAVRTDRIFFAGTSRF